MGFGDNPAFRNGVEISDSEKRSRKLEKMVEVLKGAVAMDIWLEPNCNCTVSLFCPNGATRKARRQLSAIAMSSEQSRTGETGDSVWLDIERFAALFKHGTRRDFSFRERRCCRESRLHTFVRDLGLSIAQNANSVECLRINATDRDSDLGSYKQLFSLDVWKEAFPSLQGAYLGVNIEGDTTDFSPHLMKYVRGVEQYKDRMLAIPPVYLDWIGSMIRNNVIEEIKFSPDFLEFPELLDDTLRSVRSFEVHIGNRTSWDLVARSFERTKAEGDKLERLSVDVHWCNSAGFFSATALDTIMRTRPNLQVLHVTMGASDSRDVVVALFQAVALSTLTAFTCSCRDMFCARVEAAVVVLCDLLQHSTIRILELRINFLSTTNLGCDGNDFVQGLAEGLRATRLRRFHFDAYFCRHVSIASMTKLYESVRENRSLMDIQLRGFFWDTWRTPWRYDLPDAPPCPFNFFEFLSSRNQYLSQLFLPYEYTLPAGLWPLILESVSCDASILYFMLTFQPHIVKGKVEGAVAADKEWDVDGPSRKCRRIA